MKIKKKTFFFVFEENCLDILFIYLFIKLILGTKMLHLKTFLCVIVCFLAVLPRIEGKFVVVIVIVVIMIFLCMEYYIYMLHACVVLFVVIIIITKYKYMNATGDFT